MVTPSTGAVILVPFPFSDLSRSKLRPAICLADAGHGDWILCQVTSNAYADRHAVPVAENDLLSGTLHQSSFARPARLFTASHTLMAGSVGRLRTEALQRILDAVISILRPDQNLRRH